MHKHMATLIGNCEQSPTHWRHPTTFLLPSLQSRGAVPSTRRPFQTLCRVQCRPSPQNCATRLGVTRPCQPRPPHGKRNAAFLLPNLHSGGVFPSTGGLCLRCAAHIAAHRRRIAPCRWAQPAHHRHPHPHRKRPAAFPSPNLQTRGVVPSTRRP